MECVSGCAKNKTASRGDFVNCNVRALEHAATWIMKHETRTTQPQLDAQAKNNSRRTVQFADEDYVHVLANGKQYGLMPFGYLKNLSQKEVILQEDIQVKTSGFEKWFAARYSPPRLLATIAIIVAAIAVIYWIDTRTSIRSELALMWSFLIWIAAITACLWIWTEKWRTAVALQLEVSNALRPHLSKLSWETTPKIVVAIAIIVFCLGLFQFAASRILKSDNNYSADTLQRLADQRALAIAAPIEKIAYTDDKIEKYLMSNELYRSVRASSPRAYAQIFQKFKSGVQTRKGAADLDAEVMPIVNSIFTAALPYASDDDLLQFTRFFVKEATILKREKPSDCYFVLNPRKANPRLILAIRNRHPELRYQEAQIQAQILRDFSSNKDMVLPGKINVSMLLSRINVRLRRRKDVDVNLLFKENIAPD